MFVNICKKILPYAVKYWRNGFLLGASTNNDCFLISELTFNIPKRSLATEYIIKINAIGKYFLLLFYFFILF